MRLVVRRSEARQGRGDVLLDRQFLVHGPVALRHRARIRALVVVRVREAHCERAHRLGRRLRHQGHDDARVDAAREERSQRHVGDQPLPHRRSDRRANPLEPLLLMCARLRRLELPVPLDALVLPFGDEHVPRRQLVDVAQRRPVTGDVLEREVGVDCVEVDLT
jgi:hypothetical protein